MTWREIFTYNKKLETPADKLRFYGVFGVIGVLIGAAYSLIPFAYDHDFLEAQTRKDLDKYVFLKNKEDLKDTRFSFIKKDKSAGGCDAYIAYSKYTNYVATYVDCDKEVKKGETQ